MQARSAILLADAAIAREPLPVTAHPLIEQMAAPTILRVHEESAAHPYPPMERIDAIYGAIKEAGERVLELLG
jgi:hypothetical protein